MIDIIVPCVNEPKFLKSLLASAEKNIMDLSNIHFYIVDDNSNYENEYKEIVNDFNYKISCSLYRNESRKGPGLSRNVGLENSKGDYIVFIDDDDLIINDIQKIINQNQNYDFILTNLNHPHGGVETALNYVFSLQGTIFSKSFIDKYDLRFPVNMTHGMEDSVFRIASFFLSDNYAAVMDYHFYRRVYRKDSNFTINCVSKFATVDRTANRDVKNILIFLSNVYQNLNNYPIVQDLNIFIFRLYEFIFSSIEELKTINFFSRYIDDLRILMIYGVLKYYNPNNKIDIEKLTSIFHWQDTLEFIDFCFEYFKYDNSTGIIILNKDHKIEDYVNSGKHINNIINDKNVFLTIPADITSYYPTNDLIYIYANNYYDTQFENRR